MIKQFLTISAMTIALTSFQPALADDHEDKRSHHGKHSEEFKNLSKEERKALKEERKAKWESLSDAEKIELIEKKRSEKRAKMDEKWEGMSDAEKIEFVEERRKRKGEKRKGRREERGSE